MLRWLNEIPMMPHRRRARWSRPLRNKYPIGNTTIGCTGPIGWDHWGWGGKKVRYSVGVPRRGEGLLEQTRRACTTHLRMQGQRAVQRGKSFAHYLLERSSIKRSPALTTSPGCTRTRSTTASECSAGTSTLISSFIASRIDTVCPDDTFSPASTSTFHTFEAVGASMLLIAGSDEMRCQLCRS